MSLKQFADALPEYAKDIRLNLGSILSDQLMGEDRKNGLLLACAHGSGSKPSSVNSGGSLLPWWVLMKAFTPAMYASICSRASRGRLSQAAPAARPKPTVRRKRSSRRVAPPRISDSRPVPTRRWNSICHSRSCACT